MHYSVHDGQELTEAFAAFKDGDSISLKTGIYEISKTLEFGADNITVDGNGSALKGSVRIPVSGSGVVEIDLREHGITDFGSFGGGPYEDFWKGEVSIPKPHLTDLGPGLELYFDGKLMPISRYPKEGFLKITEALGETPLMFKGKRNGSVEGVFRCNDDKIKDFKDTDQLLLVGYWNADWATQRHTVKSIGSDGVIEVNKPWHTFGYRDGECFTDEIGGKFCVLNAAEAVTAPGDWCINRRTGKLYVYLFEGQDYVEVSVAGDLFYGDGRRNIKISDLNLSQCRKSGICFENSHGITIENCNVKNSGAWGILGENCMHMSVRDCSVSETGGGGIALWGGDRNTLTPSANVISRCEITKIARWHKTYMAAIEIGGVGGCVSENKIHDVPHFGIVFSGNNQIIEKNDIGNACYESNDAGAIYTGRDYSYRGHIIRYNYLHDMYGFENRGCIGLYFDDAMSSAEVYGNVFANMPYIALLLGGGRDFDIHDNMFYGCKMAVMVDARASRWKNFSENIMKVLGKVDYKGEIWKNAYPKLYDFLDNDPLMPLGNKLYGNCVVGGDGFCIESKEVADLIDMKGNKFVHQSKPGEHEINHYNWYYVN